MIDRFIFDKAKAYYAFEGSELRAPAQRANCVRGRSAKKKEQQ